VFNAPSGAGLPEAAARWQVSETELAAAPVRALVCRPAADFDAAAQRLLHKNEELDRRLIASATPPWRSTSTPGQPTSGGKAS